MRIILSPAKRMRQDTDSLPWEQLPRFLPKTRQILEAMQPLSPEALQSLWDCSSSVAARNLPLPEPETLETGLTPAVLAYDGIAYQHMAPGVFTNEEFSWLRQHLRILSGFYGVLEPMDGIRPYRLEMQAKLSVAGCRDLYEFWGRSLRDSVRDEDGIIVNLASREYSVCIEKYLAPSDRMIHCFFGQMVRGKPVQKATFAKMARGEMVRFLAERQAEQPEVMQRFDRLGFSFRPELSGETVYTFLR